jgi:glyoxylase-like metal-dependent hydrolase (beta-lactamase superfamily II)
MARISSIDRCGARRPGSCVAATVIGAVIIAQLAAAAPPGAVGPGAALEPVAAGVYLQRGAMSPPSAANAGATGNLGVIVGDAGVIAINTGSSLEHGEAFLAAIARLTDRPVVLAIDTQASPDQVLGNAAFAARGVAVLAQRETARTMASRCEECMRRVTRTAGPDLLARTRPSQPTRLIDGSITIEAGGRTLDLLYFGATEQPGALAVFDRASGVLFTGDIASFGVVPETQLGEIARWIDALGRLQALPATVVVPGHGPPGPKERLAQVAAYLAQLVEGTRAAYRRGVGLLEVVDEVALPDYAGWALYRDHHRRNVHFVYLQVEQQEFDR